MAELIDKKDAIAQIKSIPYATQEEVLFMSVAVSRIRKLPTTTEAEIKAKAISDFLQFVYDNASNEEYANEDGWAFSDLMDLEYKFAEQLKEENEE